MSEERRVGRDGIHIDPELAEKLDIEEELDANVEGPYRFPPPERRRASAWIMVVFAVLSVPTLPRGWLVGIGFALLAVWLFASSWPLAVDEHRALRIAGGAVDFPVGHASAVIRFSGVRARPHWSVVVYSATEPPDTRALVLVDGVDGSVKGDPYVEPVAPV
ncbi:MAG: hypothetical protein J5I28_09680 [Acidimicrobiales bacterium]|jgi:hypothetical protein|nr:hypothetical protein [Acidimicrobiales bacterium]HLV91327.1 hypothetical protein [Acidimicrobiia bacterium]